MGETLTLTFFMYGLAIVISMLAAVMIRLIVSALSVFDRNHAVAASASAKAVAPPVDQTEEDIPAIAAAVYAMIGTHRIVHIEDVRQGLTWTAEGRWQHQTSHQTAHHPAH